MMIIHNLLRLCLILICSVSAVAPANAADNDTLMDRLISAYPECLAGHDGNELIWKDGTRMPFDDGRRGKEFETLLNAPSIKDMFYAPYIHGKKAAPPDVNIDPGRVRYEQQFPIWPVHLEFIGV